MPGPVTEPHPKILVAEGWKDYALLDSGDGWKLERVGPYKFARPEPQALWRAQSNPDKWQVDARFSPAADEAEEMGRWRTTRDIPESWPVNYRDIAFPRALHALPASRLFSRAGRPLELGRRAHQAGRADFELVRLHRRREPDGRESRRPRHACGCI
jgi:hypothetical protein